MLKEYTIDNNNKISAVNSGNIKVFYNPTEEEKQVLIDVYKIDDHTLNSALDDDELARMEYEPDHVAMIVKGPRKYMPHDDYLFRVMSLGLFFFKDKLIIVSNDEMELFQGKQMQQIHSLTDLLFKIIFRLIFNFYEHLRIINKISEDFEHKINTAIENKYLLNLFSLEKSLVYYLNAINSNGVLIEKIKYNSSRFTKEDEELEMLEDIIIENTQCYRQADIYANILTTLTEVRSSIVSNNVNLLMKTLNLITIAISVPTLIASVYGMNVKGLPFSEDNMAFEIVIGFMTIAVLGLLVFWWWKKW